MLTPAPLLPRFREAARALPILAERESWSRDELQRYQLERLNKLWVSAIVNVPYYKALAAERGLPGRFEDLAQFSATVPVLKKQAVRENADAFLAANHGAGQWRKTSGSTGTPMRFFASDESHQATLRGQYRLRQMWNVGLFDPMVMMMGTGAAPGASRLRRWRAALDDRLRCRLRLPVKGINRDTLRGYLRQIERFRPKLIYGYSRAIQLLAQEAKEVGFHCDALKVVILTSEPAPAALRAEVETGLGARTAVEYGATECQLIAGEGPDGVLRVRDDLVLAETLPRDDGRWDIVVTVLTNADFPLMRYRIEDLAEAPIERPEKGMSTIGTIAGRNDDWIVAGDGRKIHPAEIDAIFEGGAHGVRRYRVHQESNGKLEVAIETRLTGMKANEEAIKTALKELVADRPVAVKMVDAIDTTPAGKHRLVTSDWGK